MNCKRENKFQYHSFSFHFLPSATLKGSYLSALERLNFYISALERLSSSPSAPEAAGKDNLFVNNLSVYVGLLHL